MADVLIVDDEAEVRSTLARHCSYRGHHVHLAASGVEAIEVGRRVRPQVAIVDFALPVLSGQAAFAALRVEFPHLHGYGISGVFGAEEGSEQARAVGMLAFLAKPFLPSVLFDLVEVNLRNLGSPWSSCETNKQTNKQTNASGWWRAKRSRGHRRRLGRNRSRP